MLESNVGLSIISEPPRNVSVTNRWFVSGDHLAAILWNVEVSAKNNCKLICSGTGFVIVKLGDINIISCYVSPNATTLVFERMLDELSNYFATLTGPILFGGDLNAKSSLWNPSVTDRRGALMERFAASYDLRLLNQGGVFTCVRPQGRSVIDLTWVTSNLLRAIRNWSVRQDLESLSDHFYIDFEILFGSDRSYITNKRRWNFRRMDKSLFAAALEFLVTSNPGENIQSPDRYTSWLMDKVKDSCNVSALKIAARNGRRSVHWWSDEISDLRKAAVKARRRLTKSRQKSTQSNTDVTNYKLAKKALRAAIKKAKGKAWNELIMTIDKDPWGLPYKLVLNKLRRTSPTLSETLDSTVLNQLLDTLFPVIADSRAALGQQEEWHEEWRVLMREVEAFAISRDVRNAAPGPDSIKAGVWKCVPQIVVSHLAELFTLCFREGIFPSAWKRAVLVLIPKGPSELGTMIKARSICLLDDIGKIFERVIADRLNGWLNDNPVFSLSENQFGFRIARSTIDALNCVKAFTSEIISEGGYAIAVGLDVANAFNSVPWSVILTAMEKKNFPLYLRRIVGSYLSCRSIIYKNNVGQTVERQVWAGVPQGSVLGPLLWNIAFDSVLRLPLEEGCKIICYADDTMILSSSNRLFAAIVNANIQIARVRKHITELGLKIAENKTEAVLFYNKKPKIMPSIKVGDTDIQTAESMRYLGVLIDSTWRFRFHFNYIEEKLNRMTRALSRLMPNLRGPSERKRHFYATVLTSVFTYAAPVWASVLSSSPERVIRPLRRIQRTIAIRVISAYRTVSFDAATLLARMPPWTLEASLRRRVR